MLIYMLYFDTPFNSNQVNFPSLNRQKTSENLWCFDIFQGGKKINIDLEWVTLVRNIDERWEIHHRKIEQR